MLIEDTTTRPQVTAVSGSSIRPYTGHQWGGASYAVEAAPRLAKGIVAATACTAFSAFSMAVAVNAETQPINQSSVINSVFLCRKIPVDQVGMVAALQELIEYRQLENGWDGAGSVRPRASAIDDAIQFFRSLPWGASPPEPTVSADGSVGWYWSSPSKFISINFTGNGRYSYYGDVGSKTARGVGELIGGRVLPGDLLDLIQLA